MKKHFIVLLLLALLCACTVGLVACGHTHNWSTEWKYDDTHHWHTCDGCEELGDKAPHTIEGDKCTICGRGGFSVQSVQYEISEDGTYAICTGIKEGSTVTDIQIAESFQGKPVKKIANEAFISTEISNIIIPNSVTNIGDRAFNFCDSLTSIIIPESVNFIGDWVFNNCKQLTSVTLHANISKISNGMFANCTSLSSINIPNNIISIGGYSFYNCDSLTNINIPENVTNIGDCSFAMCDKLVTINIPQSVTVIGNYLIESSNYLTTINYIGTKEQFKEMNKSILWDDNSSNYIIKCTDGEIKKSEL